jgi:hypothetical protein
MMHALLMWLDKKLNPSKYTSKQLANLSDGFFPGMFCQSIRRGSPTSHHLAQSLSH